MDYTRITMDLLACELNNKFRGDLLYIVFGSYAYSWIFKNDFLLFCVCNFFCFHLLRLKSFCFFIFIFFYQLLECVCATGGIHDKEETRSDFPCCIFFSSFNAIYFSSRKEKKNALIFFERGFRYPI